jgi:hypothetical protein
MAQMPRQSGAPSLGALALTKSVAPTAGKRAAALEPAAGATSSTTAGSSLTFFTGMSSSRSRSWNSLVSCLHSLLCPRFQSATWHSFEQ